MKRFHMPLVTYAISHAFNFSFLFVQRWYFTCIEQQPVRRHVYLKKNRKMKERCLHVLRGVTFK